MLRINSKKLYSHVAKTIFSLTYFCGLCVAQEDEWKTLGLLEVDYKTIEVKLEKYDQPVKVEYGSVQSNRTFPWQDSMENQWHLVNKPEVDFESWARLVHPDNINDKQELQTRFSNQKSRYPTPQSVKDDPLNTPYATQYIFGEIYYRSDKTAPPILVIVYLYDDAFKRYKESALNTTGFLYQAFKKHDRIWKSIKERDPVPGIQLPIGGLDFHEEWLASDVAFLATNGQWLPLAEENLDQLAKSLIDDFKKVTD
jgi:hypothetical protein